MNKKIISSLILLSILCGIMLAGCGQTGPLYLPADETKQLKE